MIKIFSLCTFLFTIFLSTPSIHAAALSRDRIIQQEMDCMAKHADGVTWSDVCYTNNEVPDQRLAAIDAQLNQIESVQPEDTQVVSSQEGIIIPPIVDPKPVYPFAKKHSFDFGTEVYYYRYVEIIPIYIKGIMNGYYATYMYRPKDNILDNEVINVYGLEGHYASGDLNYKGSAKDKGGPNSMYEIRGVLGKDYVLQDSSRVTPYFGFAYRYLRDKRDDRSWVDGSTLFIGWDRQSNYYYVPIGVQVDIPDGRDGSIGLNFEYDYFLQGTQQSTWGGDGTVLQNHQESGYGLRGAIKFTKKMSVVNVYFEPFMRYWSIDTSSLQTATVGSTFSNEWNEPSNYTMEIGSKFGLNF